MRSNPRASRAGFTLIELLVVIAIMAVLTGMILAGVMRARDAGTRAEVRNEITGLSKAITEFEQTVLKGNGHIPSRIVLREDGAYQNNQLESDSRTFLKKCFPKCGLVGMDWNGDGTIQTGAAGAYVLEGHQCLVFFLGGINGVKGFSTNEANPTDNRRDRIGPFFVFKTNRMNITLGAAPNPAFPSYNDPYGERPYLFFSTYKRDNGYNRYGNSDCLGLGVNPAGAGATYQNPKSFQILAAGRDKLYGTRDDMANYDVQ